MKILKSIISCVWLIALVACGGGGGTESSVPKEPTFDLQSIFGNYVSAPHNYSVVTSGTSSGLTVSGSGARSMTAATAATFENSTAQSVTETRTGTINVAGQTQNIASEIKDYYNLSKQRVGYTQRDPASSVLSNYGVVQGAPMGFPVTAKIGDSGNLWRMNIYSDATKKTLSAVQTATWTLKSGVGSSVAALEINEILTAPNNPASMTAVTQYSIDSGNGMTLMKVQTEVKNGATSLSSITDVFTRK